MATPEQIEAQVKLEREAIQCGIDKLLKNTKDSEEREYASSSVYGVASIKEAQSLVAKELLNTFKSINKGKNGKYFAEIRNQLMQFDDAEQVHILANITLKRVFDCVFSLKRKESKRLPNSVTNITVAVGASVEHEIQMRWYESQDPKLFKNIKDKYWKSTTGTTQKASVARLMMARKEYIWKPWSAELRGRLGAWLLDCVMRTTGWFERTNIKSTGKNQVGIIVPSDAYLAIQKQLMDQALLFAPMSYPMLIEPNDWSPDHKGGYLLNEIMRMHDLVRHGNSHVKQPETCLAFLNRLQKVGYRINPFILEVANQLEERGFVLGKFKPLSHASLWEHPAPPPDIEENDEARFQWRKKKTESENNKKTYMKSLHVRTTITLELANKFKDADAFYLPWSFDYRGRAYPIPAFLTPHDTDFGKSLLRFSEESFLTADAEDWLAFQVATTYGLDKAPMQERLDWVRNNFTLISAVAQDPLGNIGLWESTDEPWQFLAACEEYYHCCIACDRQFTGLMVAVDASCSGLQILAGLARDAGTARLVNVLPSDKPQDAYRTVAEAMSESIPDRWKPYVSRSTTKRSVMTIPYNATLQSSRDYIRLDLMDKKPDDMPPPTSEELTQMAKGLRAAMDDIAPGPLRVMDWIGKEMYKAIKRGNNVISWETPSGFKVQQKKDHFKTKQLSCQIMGRCRFNVWDTDQGPNAQKHKSSGAPNLIHSLDASLLHLTFQRFDVPFSVIHDSVLCRATDMSSLSAIVRETYMHLFAEHDYLKDFAASIGAETEPPIIGDLEPSSVIESTYFFC